MEKKINIIETLTNGVNYGIANFIPLLLTVVLFVLTCWIPYLNVCTTIGFYKAIISIGKGEKLDPMVLFNKENFGLIGDWFLLSGLTTVGVIAGVVMGIIPGLVIAFAWMFSKYLLIDKKVSPIEALSLSYKATRGEKWLLFGLIASCIIAFAIISSILGAIPKIGGVLVFIAAILFLSIVVAVIGLTYVHFSKKVDVLLGIAEPVQEETPAAE